MTWLFVTRNKFRIALAALVLSALWLPRFDNPNAQIGVTFNPSAAEERGLNPIVMFEQMLLELKPRVVRIPIEWSRLESERGNYSFDEFDHYIIAARRNQARVIVVLGAHQPTTTGCDEPLWLAEDSPEVQTVARRNYFLVTSSHFKTHQNIVAWQIEDHPTQSKLGVCETLDDSAITEEIAWVRARDNRPIVLTTDVADHDGWVAATPSSAFTPPSFTRLHSLLTELTDEDHQLVVTDISLTQWQAFRAISHSLASGAHILLLSGVEDWYAARASGDESLMTHARQLFSIL
ncbi:MAG: hypothetical protein A3C15_01505 [Candidatus Magasanikbacteria bacterium RIFCSPHIGHO2_02_FULL_50_9b]|uniref:Uncharacterized protein n=1 Tax=Candidatus Magasanikbacteria bacterium RIFCSPHIGHO2_02_FULL_50_9b TaxID=1798682 RepID=A0A1F6M7Q6_9BACT|nr:MAG: hypothetical protein A3C15_01505 [Candidatus Magasanikbacteria bacterium RIFCSPHIGHO2_02_FULL_50_9b]